MGRRSGGCGQSPVEFEQRALNSTKNLGFPIDLPLELNCAAHWFYEFGATRYFNGSWVPQRWLLLWQRTVPENYFTPAVPNADLHVGCLGFGRKRDHWRWSLAGQIIKGPTLAVNTSQPNRNQLASMICKRSVRPSA